MTAVLAFEETVCLIRIFQRGAGYDPTEHHGRETACAAATGERETDGSGRGGAVELRTDRGGGSQKVERPGQDHACGGFCGQAGNVRQTGSRQHDSAGLSVVGRFYEGCAAVV